MWSLNAIFEVDFFTRCVCVCVSPLKPIAVAFCRDDCKHNHENWIGQEYVFNNLSNFDSHSILK